MGNKGSQTTTTTQAPNPAAMSAYNNVLNQAAQVGSQPYNPYTGQLVAGVNQQQQLGIGNINQNAGFAQPFISSAANYANAAAQPISASQIQNYMSPYTQNVVNATEAQFANTNAQQQNQLVGNAAAAGALGGDRLGVAQGILGGQQQTAEAPVIAGLYNQGYGQATQTALAEQQAQANAAYSLGNLGVAGQQAGLSGAGAQIGAGTLEQQTQQNLLNALYGQFQIQQAFPYQQTGWLAGIDTGVGSQMGGTSTTTAPPPNPLNSLLGLGVAGAGIYGNTYGTLNPMAMFSSPAAAGGRINGKIAGFADGGGASGVPGSPYGGVSTYINGVHGFIPGISITRGRGAPPPPQVAQPQNAGLDLAKMGMSMSGKGASNQAGVAGAPISLAATSYAPDWQGPMLPMGDPAASLGPIYARGGKVAGFADGGSPYDTFDDRFGSWSPVPSDQAATLRSGIDGYVPSAAPMPQARPRDVSGRGFAGLPPEITGGDGGLDLPEDALAFDGGSQGPIAGFAPSTAAPAASSPEKSHWGDALISAGLGMMASRSPFLGVGIGQGGLQGFQTFLSERQQDVANQQKQQSLDAAVKKLDQEAEFHRKTLENQTGQLNLAQRKQTFEENKPVTVPMGASLVTRQGQVISQGNTGLSANATEIAARQLINGDLSGLTNVGRGTQGDAKLTAIKNRAAEILTQEGGMSTADAAATISSKLQAFKASGVGQSAEARTAGNREANLNLILATTQSAIPAALEASENVARTGWVPINKIIQQGQVIASDPNLKAFGMANLQLAEAWARAMNPTGVMRESDRDKALSFLSTTDSPDTYKRAVMQLQNQIQRERDAVHSQRPAIPGGAAPSESAGQSGGPLAEARAAIAAGKPRDAVIQRLREHGIDPTGL